MLQTVFLKIRRWESSRGVKCPQLLETGDIVIVETEDGLDSAIIEKIREEKEKNKPANSQNEPVGIKFVRKANLRDLNVIKEHRQKEAEALKICIQEAKKSNLPMKIVGASYSFDGGIISFAFIADGRVDFRELVKTLSKNFQRSIRLHQIGARDEARSSGGYGICGRELCCIRFSDNLPSISSEMAKSQYIVRRGSDRISGLCGRLMCCLAFEAQQYQEMIKKMPAIGSEIKTAEGKGIVKKVNVLSDVILVELSDGKYVNISTKDI
jgi:cell fate regulator YaaT (PSP1 superfamily)